jgi:flagellar M-ring protein FliF
MATAAQLAKSPPPLPGQPNWSGRVAGLWGRTRIAWAQLAPAQRTRLGLSMFLLAALTGGLLWYILRTDWRTLYTGLGSDDARQISQTLTQAQIPFDLAQDGSSILVPAPELDKARLATAAKNGVKSGRLGFELFDQPNWVGSEFDEQVNYQRALEGELEHTVGTLSDVESARVHLVLPHDSLFRDDARPAKASVVLKLRRGSLAEGEPEAIRNLVASAVDGLTPDHVVLVDAAGRVPLGPKTPEALEASAEQQLEDKLVATLEPVTGAGNVRASVVLDYDRSATDTTQETYDPNQTVTLSMQHTEQTSGPQPVAAGVPGTASNAPNAQALPVYPQQNSQPATAKSESGTYAASKTVKHVVQDPGRVRRLTAAIVVNDRLVSPAVKNKPAVWQPRSAEELRQLTALAQAAIGFDSTRGDTVAVQDLAFDQNRPEPPAPLPARMLSSAEGSPLLLKYAAVLLALFLVLFLGVRPAVRQGSALLLAPGLASSGRGLPRELAGAQSGAAAALAGAPTDPERLRSQAVFEQVSSHVKRDPSQSSRLLQSWIHSD